MSQTFRGRSVPNLKSVIKQIVKQRLPTEEEEKSINESLYSVIMKNLEDLNDALCGKLIFYSLEGQFQIVGKITSALYVREKMNVLINFEFNGSNENSLDLNVAGGFIRGGAISLSVWGSFLKKMDPY